MRIIPAIDIIEGACVRLSQGNYKQKTVYSADPAEQARLFEHAGIEYLHLVDLDGAKSKSPQNWEVLKKICRETALVVDFGGGIKREEDLAKAFESGASQVTAGSISVTDRETVRAWLKKYSAERIIIGADVKDEFVYIHGWTVNTQLKLMEFLEDYMNAGAIYFICTDIKKDGMLGGSSISLYEKILQRFPDIKLIASGGISSVSELHKLQQMGLDGAIIGKSLYEGLITLEDLTDFLINGHKKKE